MVDSESSSKTFSKTFSRLFSSPPVGCLRKQPTARRSKKSQNRMAEVCPPAGGTQELAHRRFFNPALSYNACNRTQRFSSPPNN